VGRVGYGEITFLEPVDLTSLNAIADIPGGVIEFDDRSCVLARRGFRDALSSSFRGIGGNVCLTTALLELIVSGAPCEVDVGGERRFASEDKPVAN